MTHKIVLIMLILVSSCTEYRKTNEVETVVKVMSDLEVGPADYVILKYQPQWHWLFKNVRAAELSNSEFLEIENFLKVAIHESNEAQKAELKTYNKNNSQNQRTTTGYELQLEGYKRQYVPVFNENGQKEVFINFFCDEFNDWETELVQVEDGGNCYYNFKVNLVTKEYLLEINYSL